MRYCNCGPYDKEENTHMVEGMGMLRRLNLRLGEIIKMDLK